MPLAALPVQYTSSTLGDIASWVAVNKLHRPELFADCVELAKKAYLSVTSKIPFEALQLTSDERAIVAGTAIYDINDLAVYKIHSIRMSFSTNNSVRLARTDTRAFDAISFPAQGRPYQYARWGSTIEFDKPPDSSLYTYRVRFYQQPQLVVAIDDTVADTPIVTPPEWNELYEYMTLYRAYIHIDELEKARMLMEPSVMPRYPNTPKRTLLHEVGIIPQLMNDLLETINMREQGDEEFGATFLYRGYSGDGRR